MDEKKILGLQKAKLLKCIKYRDYETAIFIALCLSNINQEFNLLAGILMYENKEYARSTSTLADHFTTTAIYYKALNYKERKEYADAINCLKFILEGKSHSEDIKISIITPYIISSSDTEFFEALLGELYILQGKASYGVEKYRKSFFKTPLLTPAYGLYDENIYIGPINDLKNDFVFILFQDLFKINLYQSRKQEADIYIAESMTEGIVSYPQFKHYSTNCPGFGSYYLSKIASVFCRLTNSKIGREIFEFLHERDPLFIKELDSYSTYLWMKKNNNELGLLAKDLIASYPNSHITWSVIANYFSLVGKTKESTNALMKSLSIQESSFAYSLMGFECNSKSQYTEAQNFFMSSLSMLENNDRANFGLGVSYSETFNKSRAEIYFNKALALNHRSLNMKALVVRFYVKNNENEKALEKIKEYLNLKTNTFEEIYSIINSNVGNYSDIEELIICELAEVFLRFNKRNLAAKLIGSVQCRTSTYFTKKNLIEKDG